jgi:NAD dependent epimerase/dehydratase family enzyme
MPGLPLRYVLGEMSTLLLDGQNAVPRAALAHGYRFVHPRLGGALAELAETQTYATRLGEKY